MCIRLEPSWYLFGSEMVVIALATSQKVLHEIVGSFFGNVEGGPFLGGAFLSVLFSNATEISNNTSAKVITE
eukprot:14473067-Ditylum_brightwellii.AAC.1